METPTGFELLSDAFTVWRIRLAMILCRGFGHRWFRWDEGVAACSRCGVRYVLTVGAEIAETDHQPER